MPKSKGRRKPRRVTPPVVEHKDTKVSPKWYVALMFSLMAIGVIVIISNYIGIVPGGHSHSSYLYSGLGAIALGFLMTMNYH